ncbi:uncharacterized protein LOC110693833 [Chenopodium quinoa]|uniref:uncharacterized protein LOC110693833 n=1 Tax=Chenopodium quinoa TaxID=63459 RepID=UPI000B770D65|nr:uncharacterized protein LOC110693833 [Chenopodium quinoa]
MFNLMSFYAEGPGGEWNPITPGLIRKMLLEPKNVPAFMTNLHMEYLEEPFKLVGGHNTHQPGLGNFAEMVDSQAPKQLHSDVCFVGTPICTRPGTRSSKRQKSLVRRMAGSIVGGRNKQRQVDASRLEGPTTSPRSGLGETERGNPANVRGEGQEEHLVGVQPLSGSIRRTIDSNASYETKKEMLAIPEMKPGMSILLWNARGLARDGFRRNIHHLIQDHYPEIVILTETKVSKSNCEDIIDNLPFNSFEVVHPVGLSGGILILWNSGVNLVTTVSKEPRATHAVVQVNNSTTFLLSSIYGLELWNSSKIMSSSISLPWLVCGVRS